MCRAGGWSSAAVVSCRRGRSASANGPVGERVSTDPGGWVDLPGSRGGRTRVNLSGGGGRGGGCLSDAATGQFGSDSRLLTRSWPGGCTTTYMMDQAGNRIAEVDRNGATVIATRYQRMSYTALNQLYASVSNTDAPGYYDANWHWYDADGLRAKTMVFAHFSGNTYGYSPPFNTVSSPMTYYVYDGGEVALTIEGQSGTFNVRRRFVSLGVDAAVAGRFQTVSTGMRTLALLSDHQGTTVGALRADGINEVTGDVYSRDPFGRLTGVSSGTTAGVGNGFAGGSTPNPGGGFTYFRNRWYDPATGRFLTQDPIGLAGGVNLYAYAGNNPTTFSDPYGL